MQTEKSVKYCVLVNDDKQVCQPLKGTMKYGSLVVKVLDYWLKGREFKSLGHPDTLAGPFKQGP